MYKYSSLPYTRTSTQSFFVKKIEIVEEHMSTFAIAPSQPGRTHAYIYIIYTQNISNSTFYNTLLYHLHHMFIFCLIDWMDILYSYITIKKNT